MDCRLIVSVSTRLTRDSGNEQDGGDYEGEG